MASTDSNLLTTDRLLEIFRGAFLAAGMQRDYEILNNPNVRVGDQLRYIIDALNQRRFVVVLDNFESNLNDATRRIRGDDLPGFYAHLLTHLSGDSRAIITSRYRPADVPTLPTGVHEEALADFLEADFLKFLLRDSGVEVRYYSGDLPQPLLHDLHRLLGGTPRFVHQMREVLKSISAETLRDELANVDVPPGGEPGVLQRERDAYCERIFTRRLYDSLPPESQRALSRAAIYGIRVNLAGLEAVTGEPVGRLTEFAGAWHDRALAYPEKEGTGELWTVYGLLRSWLLAPDQLSLDERLATHRLAGDFLRDLRSQKREGELGLSWVDCLLEARRHYLFAGTCEPARAVTDPVSGMLVRQGLYDHVVRLNLELLDCEEHPGPMNWIARAYAERADFSEARDWYERSLAVAGKTMPAEAAGAFHGLASIDLKEGDYAAARRKFGRSLATRRMIRDRAGEAATWHQLATLDVHQGHYAAARRKFGRSLAIKRMIRERAGEAATWHNLATIDQHEGNYAAARKKLEQALAIDQAIEDRAGEATTWHQLATLDVLLRDHVAAREKFGRSLTIKQAIRDRAGEATTWHALATIDMEEREYAAALEKFGWSLEVKQEIEDLYGEAVTFYQLGVMAERMGRLAEGIRLVTLCYSIEQAIGHGNTDKDRRVVAEMASRLNFTQKQFEEMLAEVAVAYAQNRGLELVRKAFPEG